MTHAGGHIRTQGLPLRLQLHDRRQRVREILARKGPLAGEHLEEHYPERPDDGALIDRLATRLLRTHVGRGAEDHPGLCHRRCGQRRRLRHARRRACGRVQRLSEAEVEHLDRAVGAHLDVGGFQIAVNDPLFVGGFERLGDLFRDRQRLVDGNRAAGDPLRQVFTLNEFHDEGVHPRRFLKPVDRGDVRMVERRQRLGLALEPCEAFGISGERVRQDLDRDLAAERGVGAPPDLPHPALADLGRDVVNAEPGAGGERHTGAVYEHVGGRTRPILVRARAPRPAATERPPRRLPLP